MSDGDRRMGRTKLIDFEDEKTESQLGIPLYSFGNSLSVCHGVNGRMIDQNQRWFALFPLHAGEFSLLEANLLTNGSYII